MHARSRIKVRMEDTMKKLSLALLLAALLCAACIMTAGPHGAGIAIAPPLPIVVELNDPYYEHGGYHYYHNNDQWYYSQSRGGPWVNLPRDRYPKEVRYKGQGHGQGQGQGKGSKSSHDRD